MSNEADCRTAPATQGLLKKSHNLSTKKWHNLQKNKSGNLSEWGRKSTQPLRIQNYPTSQQMKSCNLSNKTKSCNLSTNKIRQALHKKTMQPHQKILQSLRKKKSLNL